MSFRACLGAASLGYPEGDWQLWAYLNWALGLRTAGCGVTWLEAIDSKLRTEKASLLVAKLRSRLEPYGLADRIALCSTTPERLYSRLPSVYVNAEAA